jgi:general secretion pathway protein G
MKEQGHMRTQVKRAFTLIEILIVVVILGILAAIVIPQFTDASQQAQNSSVRSQLQTLRGQIELYRVKNGGADPALDTVGWDELTLANPPYLQAHPKNPLVDPADATVIGAAAGAGVAWVWRARAAGLPFDIFACDESGAEIVE